MAGMGKVFSAVEALVVMGRNKGIGVTLINQRAATVNKDVLTQLDTLLAFRNLAPQDRKALKEWVEAHSAEGDFEKFMKSLPSLPTGEGWIWSPEFMGIFKKIKIRKRETFHPDREKLGIEFEMPKIEQNDVQSFIEQFNSSQSKDKKEKKPSEKVALPMPSFDDSMKDLKNEYESKLIEKDSMIHTLKQKINSISSIVGMNNVDAEQPMSLSKNEALIENLPNYEKTIMLAIKQHPNIPFSRSQLAIKSNKSIKSSAFSGAVVRLKKLGLIQMIDNELVYKI